MATKEEHETLLAMLTKIRKNRNNLRGALKRWKSAFQAPAAGQ